MNASRSLGPSAGRVKALAPGQNYGFVHDFRMDADVFALFEYATQAFPGELIQYELHEQGEEGRSRLRAEDIQFYPRLSVDQVLDWAREGLGAEGLTWLKREIARQPELISRVFGPHTAPSVKERLLADAAFPLPASLVEKALALPRWRKHALPRLHRVSRWTPELFQLLCEASLPESEFMSLLVKALESRATLPLELPNPPRVKARPLYNAWRQLHTPALLLLIPHLQLNDTDARTLAAQLEAHPDLLHAFRAHDGGRSWSSMLELRWLAGEDELPTSVLADPVLPGILLKALGGARHARAVDLLRKLPAPSLDTLQSALPRLTTPEERAWVLAQLARQSAGLSGLNPDLCWQLVDHGSSLDVLRSLPAAEFTGLRIDQLLARTGGLELLLERGAEPESLVRSGRALLEKGLDAPLRQSLLNWLGTRPEAADWVREGLAGPAEQQAIALEMATGLPSFSRAFVQQLLMLPMDSGHRRALVQAIDGRNPERWTERYLVTDEEKQAWRDAGASLL